MLAATPRVLKLLPALLFLLVFGLFLLNLYEYEYPEVSVPLQWKDQAPKEVANPVTTPSEPSDSHDAENALTDDQEFDPESDEGAHFDWDSLEDSIDHDHGDDGHREQEQTEYPQVNPDTVSDLDNSTNLDSTDWTKFAYVQYVTDEDYLCNSVMAFETLHRLDSRADRLMMYPSEMMSPDADSANTKAQQLLIKARDEYNVKLQPIQVQHKEGDDLTWADSFTKLLAFNQTQYDRVLSLDSDGMVLQSMDELFLLPPCPVAMPRAYWLQEEKGSKFLSSQVMVIQPSADEFERILEAMDKINSNDYDMEIVNNLYLDSALILPHRKYNMLSAEYRKENHTAYLGSEREEWDPLTAYNEAKFVHFSDWPVPKPWLHDLDLRQEHEPQCRMMGEELTCIEREIWNKLYTDFALTRKRVCTTVEMVPEQKGGFWERFSRR
ncbi:hypothetical protein F66182_4546 [Fusarium sp. NRRL 66182]|nr:hypothetical protein F66182_4546 [Fusarium sp. NRRL 66182]